jgi:hypothetical protein
MQLINANRWMASMRRRLALVALSVFCLLMADSRVNAAPAETHAQIGSISWDTIPANVRTKTAGVAPFRQAAWAGANSTAKFRVVLRRAGESLDVLVTPGGVMLQKEKGILDVALEDKTADFIDAVPDGRDIWISSLNKGIFLLDHSGKLLGKIDETGGLPKSDSPMQIVALAPGLVVASGSTMDAADPGSKESWVAAVSYNAKEGAAFKVAVIASESRLPAGWLPPAGDRKWRFDPVRVIAIGNVSDADEDPRAWLLVKGPREGKFTSVQVNARTLEAIVRIPKATVAAAGPEGLPPVQGIERDNNPTSAPPVRDSAAPPGAHRMAKPVAAAPEEWMPFTAERDSIYQSDGGHLYSIIYHRIYSIPVGQMGISVSRFKRLADIPTERGGDFLPLDNFLYIAGRRWNRLDPKTEKVEDIGPGLQIAGASVEDGVSYAVSAHFGICAFSSAEGCFHPFSVDPAKPLRDHAANDGLNAPVYGKPAAGTGRPRYVPPIIAH